jgi:tRNA modification GTPase
MLETIAAIATPSGRGGIGIIRISGPKVREIAQLLLRQLPKPRAATYLPFHNQQHEIIDEGIAVFFPAPHSFTGEDVLELQGHGGAVVLDCLLKEVLAVGARLARPGEFSERAFLNDKMDLAQAEAIADLIDASSQQAARSALRSLQGDFSRQVHNVVAQLIQLRLFIEAAIDFPTEEIDFISESTAQQDLMTLIESITTLKNTAKQGALLRDGMTVAIAGKPNAGKSSLLNNLSGRDSAIVTDIPGTTRDVLREVIHLDGMPLHIIDTAGLRETQDIIEQEGIRRTRQAIQQADAVLWIIDAGAPLEEMPDLHLNKNIPWVIIRNKIDLTGESPAIKTTGNHTLLAISAKFNQGLDLLKNHLKQLIGFNENSEGIFIARRRHITAIDQALDYLRSGHEQLSLHQSSELVAQDLKHAQAALNTITGEFTADDLLGKIFSSFCIGK